MWVPSNRPHRGRNRLPLGGWLIVVLIALGYFALRMLSSTSLLWHGVTTKGVITSVGTESCGRSSTGPVYSIQFTDQTGQTQISPISHCTYNDFTASPRDSITIVHLPMTPPRSRHPTDCWLTSNSTCLCPSFWDSSRSSSYPSG